MECKSLRDSGAELRHFDIAYFMVSTDPPDVNKAFAEAHEANFPLLSDPQHRMTAKYGVLTESGVARRWTFYIDREGIIRRIDKAVNPLTAGAALAGNLTELRFGSD